jgi:hypothetical protein
MGNGELQEGPRELQEGPRELQEGPRVLQRLNMRVNEHWFPIYNIHVHNKNLKRWLSDIPEMTKHLPNIL